ncbi:MAG: undecaprenyl-diphosphatase UppP [Ignavibacteriaceae bacterium]|nr:undecaprenyl-diphosphatase UppP [Ignavibacteriaceae bacterium]
MSLLEAIFLGLIQGLTEFLPISSTGHLTLTGKLMNLISTENPEHWTSFMAVIQLGTLAAIIVYFWDDIWKIVFSFFKDNLTQRKKYKEQSAESKQGWLIIIGTIPVVIIGLAFKDVIEGAFTKNLVVIASSLIVLAVILGIAEKTAKFKKDIKDITILDSIIIGIAQAMALIPGSSRSGTTITGGLFMGLKRETAARFSFLLSIPAIFASGMLELYESLKFIDAGMSLNLIVATLVSAVSGYLAIDFLLKYLRKNTTFIFIYYRIALGILIFVLLYFNVINKEGVYV